MKTALLLHNPTAGNEEHTKRSLTQLIESGGFACRYKSVKEDGWKNFDTPVDFLVVAGGDGTVRKVATVLLNKKEAATRLPIALLPMGTANNISQSLNINGDPEAIIDSWHKNNRQTFDIGILNGLEQVHYILESFGYGVFPYLMGEMDKQGMDDLEDKDIKIKAALQLIHDIAHTYEPRECRLIIDGKDHSGVYLLAEIMNIRSIGPNLFLSPNGDPGDGQFEVILIAKEDKEKFASYIENKINDTEITYNFPVIKASQIQISWQGKHAHVDDQFIKIKKGTEVNIQMQQNALSFLIG
jgi:diacylglycerol kinase family enzyme